MPKLVLPYVCLRHTNKMNIFTALPALEEFSDLDAPERLPRAHGRLTRGGVYRGVRTGRWEGMKRAQSAVRGSTSRSRRLDRAVVDVTVAVDSHDAHLLASSGL